MNWLQPCERKRGKKEMFAMCIKRNNLNGIEETPSTAKKHKLDDHTIARNQLKLMTPTAKLV